MNREDIISMARETLEECDGKDYYDYTYDKIHWWGEAEAIIKFANLVAAAERKACAEVCELMYDYGWLDAKRCAKEIRARGQV